MINAVLNPGANIAATTLAYWLRKICIVVSIAKRKLKFALQGRIIDVKDGAEEVDSYMEIVRTIIACATGDSYPTTTSCLSDAKSGEENFRLPGYRDRRDG